MTTKVTIEPAGHHVLVVTSDFYKSPGGLASGAEHQQVMLPAALNDQPLVLYSTTTRTIIIKDLEPDDDRAIEAERAAGHYRPKLDPEVG